MEQRMLTVRGFGEAYSVGKTKTYELINSGELRRVKFGARSLIPIESAEAWRDKLLRGQDGGAAS